MEYEWDCFLFTADEWFVNYSLLPAGLSSVVLSSIGHTIELYLKATYAKNTGSVAAAVERSHNVKSLWDACKNHDKDFMPEYEIRQSVLDKLFTVEPRDLETVLNNGDFDHLQKNLEFYFVAKLLPDLKYLGTPPKTRRIDVPISYAYVHPDPYWIGFFRSLRSYLKWPPANKLDVIKFHTEQRDIPPRSIYYLSGLFR